MTERVLRVLDRIAVAATFALPLVLLHGRGLAEAAIDVAAAAFLVRSTLLGDWAWLRRPWVRVAALWWGWLVICSLPGVGQGSLPQALFLARFLLFVAALEGWVLREAARRLWMIRLVRLSALYIVAQEALQLVTGHNLFGHGRRPSGELTGPYEAPRAAPVLSRLLFPALLPPVAAWWARGGAWRAASAVAALGGVAAMVLFGQRMPVLLTGLGLVVSALLLPRLRGLVLAAGLAGALLVGASAVLAPPTFDRLVTRFSAQMADWPDSQYGRLAARAASIAQAHPVMGLGFDAFRRACARPEYWHGWPGVLRGERGFTYRPQPAADDPSVWRWIGDYGGGGLICAQHPHNHYVQAAVESGLPGLALFCALVLSWLAALGRGLWRRPDPLRVGLFVAALVQEWPIASTSDVVNMPLGGWFFLLLGIGLAQARWPPDGAAPISAARGGDA